MNTSRRVLRASQVRIGFPHLDRKRAMRWLDIRPHEWSLLTSKEQAEAIDCARKALGRAA